MNKYNLKPKDFAIYEELDFNGEVSFKPCIIRKVIKNDFLDKITGFWVLTLPDKKSKYLSIEDDIYPSVKQMCDPLNAVSIEDFDFDEELWGFDNLESSDFDWNDSKKREIVPGVERASFHKDCKVVVGSVNKEIYYYCRDCKVEVIYEDGDEKS